MASSDHQRVSFEESDTRRDQMYSTIESWLEQLVELADEARASEQFREWLAVQSRFHDYSHRNTLLIKLQCPEATKVAGYRTWQTEFDRHVEEGESAIWIWAPIVTSKCPECGNLPSYHEDTDCEYDETPPEAWSEGVVGFTPTPVFDVSQTEGEPLPELDTAARGDASELLPALLAAAPELGIDARIVPAEERDRGEAAGICRWPEGTDSRPVVQVQAREDDAAVAGTIVHEYAHALCHGDGSTEGRAERELEAEAVGYAVGRHFGLDTSNSRFYLAAWADDEPDAILERLERISTTVSQIIGAVDAVDAYGGN